MSDDNIREVRHPVTGEVWKIRTGGGDVQILSYKGPKKKIPKHLDGPPEIRLMIAMMASGRSRPRPYRPMPSSVADFEPRKSAAVMTFEAQTLEKEGKYGEALERYAEAISVDNGFAKAWFYKFKLHYKLGQMEKALDCATMAVDIEPKWAKFVKDVDKEEKLDEFF